MARWCLIAYWILLVVLTHTPTDLPAHPPIPGVDKVAHFVLYLILSILWTVVLSQRARIATVADKLPQITSAEGILLFAGISAFGLLDETTQPWFRRTFDWYDWAADCAGAIVGILLVVGLRTLGSVRSRVK